MPADSGALTPSRPSLTAALGACLLAAAVIGIPAGMAAGSARAVTPAWSDHGIRVVGGPVAADGVVLVLVSGANRSVSLEGIDGATGKLRWRVPYSFSLITSGVITPPVAVKGVALDLAPTAARSPYVRLEGIDVTSGKKLWAGRSPALVGDAPTQCPPPLAAGAFCLTADVGSTSALVALTSGGLLLATVPGIERSMAEQPGLYELSSATPVLGEVTIPGGLRWHSTVSKMFGPGHNPNFGWNFGQYGTTGVGTVSRTIPGVTGATTTLRRPLGGDITIGFDEATGARRWTLPGLFGCGGTSVPFPPPYLCLLTGSATEGNGKFIPSAGATVSLVGFDPSSGKVRWRHRVGELTDVVEGNMAILDTTHVVVSSGGRELVLDLVSGALTRPAPDEVFWCSKINAFKIVPAQGVTVGGDEREGSYFYEPCTAGMHPLASLPAETPPPLVGVTIDGRRIWATPSELLAAKA